MKATRSLPTDCWLARSRSAPSWFARSYSNGRSVPTAAASWCRWPWRTWNKRSSSTMNRARPNTWWAGSTRIWARAKKALTALDHAVRLTEDDPAAKARSLIIRANLQKDPALRQADFDEAVELTPRSRRRCASAACTISRKTNWNRQSPTSDAAILIEPKDADTHESPRRRAVAGAKVRRGHGELQQGHRAGTELAGRAHAPRRVRAIKGDAAGGPGRRRTGAQAATRIGGALQLHASLLGSVGKFEPALADLNLLRRAMPDNPELLLQIAALHQAAKQPHKAIATYDQMVAMRSEKTPLPIEAGPMLISASASRPTPSPTMKSALLLEPQNSGVLNNLAWVLATSPEEKLRDGKRAIELAKQACEVTEYKQAHMLSTLAASYAESGDFDTAIHGRRKAVEASDKKLQEPLSKELESYQKKQPWREAMPPERPDADEDDDAKPDNQETAQAEGELRRRYNGGMKNRPPNARVSIQPSTAAILGRAAGRDLRINRFVPNAHVFRAARIPIRQFIGSRRSRLRPWPPSGRFSCGKTVAPFRDARILRTIARGLTGSIALSRCLTMAS